MKKTKNIFQLIENNNKKYENKTAIIFQNQKINYKSLNIIITNLSTSLQNIGIKKGDKIGLLLHNSLEFIYVMLAAGKIGAAIVPLSTSLPLPSIFRSFLFTKVKFLIGWHTILSKINKDKKLKKIYKNKLISVGEKIPNCIDFNNLICKTSKVIKKTKDINFLNNDYIISLTSGSTGHPKPIILSQKTKLLRAQAAKKLYKLNNKDIIITATPLEHSLSQRLIFLPLIMGATLILLKNFNEKIWMKEVKKNKVTFSILVPTQIEKIFNNKINYEKNLKTLRTIVSTSAKLSQDFKKKINLFNKCNFHECYGASEIAIGTNLNLKKDSKKIKSVGKSCPNVSIKILNNKNSQIKKGLTGEIAVKTNQIFSGYLNKPKKTKSSFSKNFFKTGDLGYLDKENYLYLVGRKKNMIIVSGINVYAEDVEEVIKKFKSVKDCCVIGVENEKFGEIIIAIIILKKNKKININELKKYCFENLADFQLPFAFEFINNFPRNKLGKILRETLKKKYLKKNYNDKL